MSPTSARRVAWLVGGIAIVSIAAGGVLGVATGTLSDLPDAPAFFIALAAFPAMGILIASRQPSNRVGWLLCAIGLPIGISVFAGTYANVDPPLPGREWVAWASSFGILGLPLIGLLMLVFPDGRPPSARWRVAVWIDVTAAIAFFIASAFTPGPIEEHPDVSNPAGIDAIGGSPFATDGVAWPLVIVGLIAAVASLVVRYRRSRGGERQQLKWFVFAAAGVTIGFLITAITYDTSWQDSPLVNFVLQLSIALLPIATAIAILKHRLYDIDLVISKTVFYGVLAVFITIVYVGMVVGVGALAQNVGNALLSASAAAVVALAFQPVRRWAQRLANRLVYGKRATPYEVLSDFADRVAGSFSVDDVLPRMARVLAEGTGATRVIVWLGLGETLRPAASWPPDASAPDESAIGDLPDHAFDVRQQGEVLGAITVAMPSNEPLDPIREKLAADLAGQAGLVLRNARLIEDLRESRRRIVTAQDERAKKLERDLHDGAQQQLVALAVKQRLAATLVGSDDDRARSMLGELQRETNDALENLRNLARGIYPPILADRGLGVAIEAQARRLPVPVDMDLDGIGRYAQEVETAVYFSILEALQNVAKYAKAEHATVHLAESNGDLSFEVVDDGVGFDPAAASRGTGIQGITDRLAALNGGLELESSAGLGTVVRGRVPVRVGDMAT